MVTPAPEPDGDPRRRALTTLEGWRQFASEMPAVPQLLDGTIWQGLDPDKRAAYDDDRIAHHSRLLVVQTPAVRDVVTTGRRLAHLNRSAHYGRSGLIVSGPARTGKTTAITQLGKTIEVFHRRRYPRFGEDIPVVYITVPPAATPKMIAAEFARFLGLPVIRRANITDIIEAVCGVCTDTRTSVICVDEIHNLNIATRAGAEASDTLKYFSERIPATFVLAGINVERAGLLSGVRGEQIAGRFSMVRTGRFACDQQWATLTAALETSLRLHRHQPGTLPQLARYLHQRTGGMIGSLLWLIRSAAIQAVLDGTEKITRSSLASLDVDIAAASASSSRSRAGRET
jgi:AAA domain